MTRHRSPHRSRVPRRLGAGAFALSVTVTLGAIGCSVDDGFPDLGQVRGKVTLDGQPVKDVAVVFTPEEGRASRARTDENGAYELIYLRDMRGAILGTNKATILSVVDVPGQARVPARYSGEAAFSREVKPGLNEYDFELTTDLKE